MVLSKRTSSNGSHLLQELKYHVNGAYLQELYLNICYETHSIKFSAAPASLSPEPLKFVVSKNVSNK